MRKLLAALALALGMSLAQSYYAGGHVGIFGVVFILPIGPSFNGGIHVGVALGKGLPEMRLGVDFTSLSFRGALLRASTPMCSFP
jgi:hypothetical protein